MGQLGVSEGDVLQFFADPVDDCSEGAQGLVDELGLLEAVSLNLTLLDPFAACQVHQDQGPISDFVGDCVGSFQSQRDDEMGSAGPLVHVSGRSLSVVLGLLEVGLHFDRQEDLYFFDFVHGGGAFADQVDDGLQVDLLDGQEDRVLPFE